MVNIMTLIGSLLLIFLATSIYYEVKSFFWVSAILFTLFMFLLLTTVEVVDGKIIDNDIYKTVHNVFEMYALGVIMLIVNFISEKNYL